MMKKWPIALLIMLVSISISFGGYAEKAQAEGEQKQALTEEQKKELETMHTEMLKQEKAIIAKYVDYGLISKQAGDMLNAHMDKRFEKIKEHGYIPPHHFAKPPHGADQESKPNE